MSAIELFLKKLEHQLHNLSPAQLGVLEQINPFYCIESLCNSLIPSGNTKPFGINFCRSMATLMLLIDDDGTLATPVYGSAVATDDSASHQLTDVKPQKTPKRVRDKIDAAKAATVLYGKPLNGEWMCNVPGCTFKNKNAIWLGKHVAKCNCRV
jgi:hypothetical protein